MSFIATAIIGSAVVGGVLSSNAQKSAAKSASRAQQQAADQSIAEQRRQFDAVQQLMAPYVQSGTTALSRYNALTGLSGQEAQQSMIQQISSGAEYGALVRAGEEGILQSASATGGLRGGNTQSALAKFRPEILSSLIRDEYSRLGNMASMGQNAAAGLGNAGMQTGQNISNQYGQIGQAQAGAALARGQATANMWGNIAGSVGLAAGLGGFGNRPTPTPAGFDQMLTNVQTPLPVGIGSVNTNPYITSDIRLKADIEPMGERNGLAWYSYRYVWDEPGTKREGVMAQEVIETHPDAVITHPLGFLMVDYSKLGLENAAV
jgi:hypothetical protein